MGELNGELRCSVIEINRGTTHDGPGMRTTIFFKGCPLHCAWCQNPEGIDYAQGKWWDERKCIGCLSCLEACPYDAISNLETGIHTDRAKCQVCGACVEACPSQAMAFTGREWTLPELVREALKDRDYHAAFGGGVTVSGGEPLGQYPFVHEFLKALKSEGVHTALDTCGYAPVEAFDAVLPYVDHVLFDLKLLDSDLHRVFTGKSNRVILDNLLYVAKNYLRPSEGKRRLWIRTPLIPDATASEANISTIAGLIRDNIHDVVDRWELCAFNSACIMKYNKMDQSWAYENTGLMSKSQIAQIETIAVSNGIPREKLVISGLYTQETVQSLK